MATARIQLVTPTETTSAHPVVSLRTWSVVTSRGKTAGKRQGRHKHHRPVASQQDWSFRNVNLVFVDDDPKATIVIDSSSENWVKFQGLVEQWRNERGARSSITEAAGMPAYQKIIGMGALAVPLLLTQLKSEGGEPDQWFWALRAITDANPVKPEDQGNFRKMAKAWLQWGEENVHARVW